MPEQGQICSTVAERALCAVHFYSAHALQGTLTFAPGTSTIKKKKQVIPPICTSKQLRGKLSVYLITLKQDNG